MAGFLVGIGKAGEVAERSPAVISANLKEDMLLQKKRLVLERSERNLVHQIKIDQKVVYKNFQSKLVRSKLAFARLMGQKDIEKDLRAKNLGGLNTDIVGSADEEYAFLEKLEQRPCTASCISPRIDMPRKKKSSFANSKHKDILRTTFVGDKLIGENPGNIESLSNVAVRNIQNCKLETECDGLQIRPATTAGIRVDKDFIRHQKQINENNTRADTERKINETNKNNAEVMTESGQFLSTGKTMTSNGSKESDIVNEKNDTKQVIEGSESETIGDTVEDKVATNNQKPTVAFLDELELNLDKLQRPRTVALTGLSDISGSPPISPKHISRRASRASDFFQEEKKIDLVQLRLQAAKAVDFTDKVNMFCESLEKTQDSRNKPTSDYYTIRLETAMKERLGSEIVNVHGTPDDENKRAMGNIFIRSLTVPEINWNFVGP